MRAILMDLAWDAVVVMLLVAVLPDKVFLVVLSLYILWTYKWHKGYFKND